MVSRPVNAFRYAVEKTDAFPPQFGGGRDIKAEDSLRLSNNSNALSSMMD